MSEETQVMESPTTAESIPQPKEPSDLQLEFEALEKLAGPKLYDELHDTWLVFRHAHTHHHNRILMESKLKINKIQQLLGLSPTNFDVRGGWWDQ
jgi:hypothetical protein